MARRRYQEGTLILRKGKRRTVWIGTWRIDVIEASGVERRQVKEVLGTIEDFPTRKLARRELDRRLNEVNDPQYRARPTTTVRQFTELWMKTVLTNQKPSFQASEKSRINRHILPALGDVKLKDVHGMMLQRFASSLKADLGAKSVRNVITTLQSIWTSATDFGYVGTDPFKGVKLEEVDVAEQPCYSVEDAARIILSAEPPYNVVFFLTFETGIRRGEICALNVADVDLERKLIFAKRSRWGKHITDNKSRRPRIFSISDELAEQLKPYIEGRNPDDALFMSPKIVEKNGRKYGGKRLHPDNFVKRHLKPLLKALNLEGAMHAFRHGNATFMDTNNVPMKVRQDRLGHLDPRTTMRYTHTVSSDDRNMSAMIAAALKAELKQGTVQ